MEDDYHNKFLVGQVFDYAGVTYTVVDSLGTPEKGSTEYSYEEILGGYRFSIGGLIIGDSNYDDNAFRTIQTVHDRTIILDLAVKNSLEFKYKCIDADIIAYCYDDPFLSYNRNSGGSELILWITIIAVIISVLTLCIYLVMRTSLMNRVKEIGVYRAIGANKFDIIKSFFIEYLVLFALTVFIGFMIASGVIWAIMSIDISMLSVVFLPFWLWLVVGGGVFTISALCAMLPVLTMLRKTPAAILAKYDI